MNKPFSEPKQAKPPKSGQLRSDEGGEGDLTRRLELAIRDRSPVRVTAVAGKDEREFTLLPVSLKGGRLRATDQQAGVERTLPVSAITAVASIAA